MASYPPPYTPPGQNLRDGLRQQARAARQQARMHRNAARQQARVLKSQRRGLTRRSILGPLLILTLGILLLLVRLGSVSAASMVLWYAHWWPAILVAAGLVLVAEWAWDERAARLAPAGTTPARRGIGGGVIFLLVLLGLCGATAAGHDHGANLSFIAPADLGSFEQFFGEQHETDQPLELVLPAHAAFAIDNPHGEVAVTGASGDGQIHILVHKRVFTTSDEDAGKRFTALNPVVNLFGGTLHVSVPTADDSSTVDLTVSIPETADTSINANHGDIHVSGLHAPVHLTANRGDVEVTSLQGDLTAHLRRRSCTFSGQDINGNVTLDGVAQDLNLSSVTGHVSFDGDFYGDTHLTKLTGPVHYHTSRTDVSFARLDGTFDISPRAELTGAGLSGPVVVHSYSRNISLTDVSGSVDVSNRNGTVELAAVAPLGDINVLNQSGSIQLTLPETSSATLQADVTGGHITSDFGTPPDAGSSRRQTFTTTLGTGAAHIILRTSDADIQIEKH